MRNSYSQYPKLECPQGSNHFVKIPHPPLSTLSFRCPKCDADVDVWCREDGRDVEVCQERKAMCTQVYDQYIHNIQTHRLPLYVSDVDRRKQIQKIIKEVKDEYAPKEAEDQ